MKNLLIIGAGGHGRVVAEVAEDCGYTQVVYSPRGCYDRLDAMTILL